jgi:leucyl/phenylalanyl-tRNA--protein transferase
MSDLNDIVAVGLDLKPKTLLHAYQNGVFPWPSPGLPLLWYCPMKRAILEFSRFHVGRRLMQILKRAPWTYSVNQAFEQVIQACATRGQDQTDKTNEDQTETETWITPEMQTAYLDLHRLGHAHSIEVWNGSALVGGLYGVDTANCFAGESMFHRESNASKAALIFAVARLKSVGREWMDIQVMSPHAQAFGAREITRNQFLKRLEQAKKAQQLGTGLAPFTTGPGTELKNLRYGDFSSWIVSGS